MEIRTFLHRNLTSFTRKSKQTYSLSDSYIHNSFAFPTTYSK